jgi:hypothetical protein
MMSMLFTSELFFLDLLKLIVNIFRLSVVNKEIVLEVKDCHFVARIILLRNLRSKFWLILIAWLFAGPVNGH